MDVRSRILRLPRLASLVMLWLSVSPGRAQNNPSVDYARSVNPLVGTGGDPDDGIDLFPGAARPFGMVQLSPDTEDHGFGYHYIHKWIKGFSMTHMSGAGCANEGDVFFTATTGPIVTQTADFQSPYSIRKNKQLQATTRCNCCNGGSTRNSPPPSAPGPRASPFPPGKAQNSRSHQPHAQ